MEKFVQELRESKGPAFHIPGFDPHNGNSQAKYLLLLEAPGPAAVNSEYVSLDNLDPTARNLSKQLDDAGIDRHEILLWNIVPWYLGDRERSVIRSANSVEIAEGIAHLLRMIQQLHKLAAIVLFGKTARKAFLPLSIHTRARILTCHHPSAQSMNRNRLRFEENIKVLKNMAIEGEAIGSA